MSNWQLPTQKGTQLWPSATKAPTKLVIEGVEPGSELAYLVAQRFEGVIKQFHNAQAQNYSLGVTDSHKVQVSRPDIQMQYHNARGQETIRVRVAPGELKRLKRSLPQIPDFSRLDDGYLAIFNANAVQDDVFNVYVNDEFVLRTQLDGFGLTMHLIVFGEFGTQLCRLDTPQHPLLAGLPEDAGVYNLYKGDRSIPASVLEIPDERQFYNVFQVPVPDTVIVTEVQRPFFVRGQAVVEMRNIQTSGLANYGLIWAEFLSARPSVRTPQAWDGRPGVWDLNHKQALNTTLFRDYSGEGGQSFSFTMVRDI